MINNVKDFEMKATIIALIMCSTLLVACKGQPGKQATNNQQEAIFPKGEKGPVENFTGNAWATALVANDSTYNTLVGNVYFEPGARSNWHTHPSGQILIITDGVGYHQIEGQPRQ